MMKIKKGDTVKVIAGKDKDKEGKVLAVKDGKVLVEGVNMVTKHTKPSAANQQGGIVNKEAAIDASNVMLVVNGKASFVKGDGGWGIAPRTAIGQRKDGIVLFLVIDGRQAGYSIGADMDDLADIMVKYGAYNAANMDGGSSSALVIRDKNYNKPCCAKGQNGLRGIPTAWIVEE